MNTAYDKISIKTLKSLIRGEHVCPWWLIYFFDNRLRRIFEKPERILEGLVHTGQTVLDIGCGVGFFTLPLARIVSRDGMVIAADLQQKMLDGAKKHADRACLTGRIHFHKCRPETIGLSEPVDFIIAHWMVHEVPDKKRFLDEVYSLLKPGAFFLLVEPRGHVSGPEFAKTSSLAGQAGMNLVSNPEVGLSRAALFTRD